MGLISLNLNQSPIENRSNPMESPSVSLGNLSAIWSWISGTEPTASGELIDEHVALQIISVYSCVRLIAETVSSLPLKLYERLPKGRSEAKDNYLYDILTVAPNPEMSAVTFWETVVGCLALCGNSYVYIQRVNSQVQALWPINPKRTIPIRLPDGGLAYKTSDGMANGETRIINASDMLHFKLFSWDGLLGLSPIHLARQSLGLTRAAEKMGARLFANNGRPSGVMSTEMNLDQKTLLNVRESWQASQTGENALKTAFIPGGWKYTPIGLDMESIQFLATRQFQRSEIAALYRVPAHLIGDTTRQSNTNNEQESLTLVTLTLRPYLTRIENEIQRVLLPTVGRNANKFFAQFDIRSLLRGDFQTTMAGYALGRQWGFYNANQILEELGENPIGPVGDVYWTPVNYQNSENLLVKPEPTSQPEGTTEPATPTEDERSILDQYTSPFIRMFRDGVGRLSTREKKDSNAVSGVFEPLLRSICEFSEDHAAKRFALPEGWNQSTDRIVKESLKSLEKRCSTWTPENVDEIAGSEFTKVVRGIVMNTFREAGAASVPASYKGIKP